MIKFLLILSLISISNIPITLSDKPIPLISLNADLNSTVLQLLDNGVFISQFITYMLTGTYDGQTSASNDTSLDELTIDNLLDISFNQITVPILAEQFPENFGDIYTYVNDIIKRLNEQGTSSVKYKEIKQLFSI
jgi:hypothetical protein